MLVKYGPYGLTIFLKKESFLFKVFSIKSGLKCTSKMFLKIF